MIFNMSFMRVSLPLLPRKVEMDPNIKIHLRPQGQNVTREEFERIAEEKIKGSN